MARILRHAAGEQAPRRLWLECEPDPCARCAQGAMFESDRAAVKAKRYFTRFAIRFRTLVKYNAFRPSGEKLHQHFFTIHYYLLLAKKRQEVLVKSEE